MTDPRPELPALIVGAGPAGLAVAACLRRRGIEPLLIERADRVGVSWATHYERLHLHSPRQLSALPFMPWGRRQPTYPSRAAVVRYLQTYADRMGLRPRLGETVLAAAPAPRGGWEVRTDAGHHRSRTLVVATGHSAEPHRPALPGLDAFAGPVLHSKQYRNGAPFAGQRVLVVGCGNSGAEIAIDLVEHDAQPALLVRGPTHVAPRDLHGRPTLFTAIALARLPARLADALALPLIRHVIGDLSTYGIERPALGPTRQILASGRIPMLDIGTVAHIRAGRIAVVPALEQVSADAVQFVDGRRLPFDAIVLATGYRPSFDQFLAPGAAALDAQGLPTRHGVADGDGLYFCGFRNPPTGALREIAIEARRIARRIESTLAR